MEVKTDVTKSVIVVGSVRTEVSTAVVGIHTVEVSTTVVGTGTKVV